MRFMGTGVGHGRFRQAFLDVLRIIARRAQAPDGNAEDSEDAAEGNSKARDGSETGDANEDSEHQLDEDEDAPSAWDTEDEGAGDDEDESESEDADD